MKKILCMLLCVALIAALSIGIFPAVSANAQNSVTVTYNGVENQFDQLPFIQNNRTLVPLSTFAEALDAQIHWNEEEQSICFRNIRNGVDYYLGIDRDYVEWAGTDRLGIDVSPTIINGIVFIPVRYFAERLGFDVDWDENTRTVIITKLTHEEGVTAVITYVNNEGDNQGDVKAPPPQIFLLGQPVCLASLDYPSDVYKLDHTFDGWLDPVTGTLYFQGAIVNFDSDVILYAAFTNVFTGETVW